MEISISNKAQSNIENITKFTLKISTNYANRIVNEIYSTIDSIKVAPYIGRYVPELSDKHYRERICGNYRIIYLVSEKYNTIFNVIEAISMISFVLIFILYLLDISLV